MDDVQRTIETVLKKERTIKTVLKEARAKRDAELTTLRADLAEARADVARFEAALDAANRELAQARAERDEAMKQRDFAKDGEDNMRFLKGLWENECGFYRAQSVARLHEIDLGRRTIRALVVFGRAVWRSLRPLAGNQARWQMAQLAVKVNMLYVKKQSGQQAGE